MQRTFQKTQSPFSEGQPLQRTAPPFQHWILESRGALAPHPETQKGAPGWGLREHLPPAQGTQGGSRRPEAWPDPARHPDRPTPFTLFWPLESHPWGPSGLPLHASWESRTLATQRGCAQLKEGAGSRSPRAGWQREGPGQGHARAPFPGAGNFYLWQLEPVLATPWEMTSVHSGLV